MDTLARNTHVSDEGAFVPAFTPEAGPTHELRESVTANETLIEAARWFDKVKLLTQAGIERRRGSLDPTSYALALADTGVRVAAHIEPTSPNEGLGPAVRVLSSVPYFVLAQDALRGPRSLDRSNAAKLVHYCCRFNAAVMRYGISSHDASATGLIEAMEATYLGAGVAHPRGVDTNRILRSVVKGMQHEAAAYDVLMHAGKPRLTSLEMDLQGVDYELELPDGTIPVDIKATKAMVRHKTSGNVQAGGAWGISDSGVLVLWSHLSPEQVGDGFAVDSTIARSIYEENVEPALRAAVANPRLRRL